jgi:DNA-binding GntR family transcriptional regulator
MVKPKAKKRLVPFQSEKNISLSRGEDAYQKLYVAIQSGNLKPGTRLREVELAEWLGSSRTPVREALNRLQTQGLIIQEPRRGMIITELDHTMVAELYVMREVLEGTAAGLAARHASDVEIAMLREITDRDKKNDKSLIRRAANNRLFHETLHRCSHNRYLLRTLNTLRESMALLGTTLSLSGRSQTALAEHEAVVSAIERHDAVAAEEALRAHIRAAYRSRLRMMAIDFDHEKDKK